MKYSIILCVAFVLNFSLLISNSFAQSGWTIQANNLGANLTSIQILNNGFGYATGNNGSIYKTSNYGVNWVSTYTFTNTILYALMFVNKDTGYCAGNDYSLSQTKNGGLNWSTYVPSSTSTTFYCLAIGDTNHIYAAGNSTLAYPPYTNSGIFTTVQSSFNGWIGIAPHVRVN